MFTSHGRTTMISFLSAVAIVLYRHEAYAIPSCDSNRPGNESYRTLQVPSSMLTNYQEENNWVTALCCVYTHVVVASDGVSSPMMVRYDGSAYIMRGLTSVEVMQNAYDDICSMNMGSEDCLNQAQCIEDALSCGDLFCKDGVTNKSYVVDGESGTTCAVLKEALGFVASDHDQCQEATEAELVCCPPTEQKCFVCGGKDVKMGKPYQWDPVLGTNCKGIDEALLRTIPKASCDNVKAEYFRGFSIESFCGCEGFKAPKVCDDFCGEDQVINKSGRVPLVGMSCEDGRYYASHFISQAICDMDVNTAINQEACCVDASSDSNAESGIVSHFSMAVVTSIVLTNFMHAF